MNVVQPTAKPRLCPACQAILIDPQAKKCWLCHLSLTPHGQDEVMDAEILPEATVPLSEIFFHILLAVIVGLIVLVGVGLAVENQGWLIPYGVIVAPALLASLTRYLRESSVGSQDRGAKTLLTLIISVALTFGIIGVLLTAAVIALFLFCVYAISGGKF